MPPLRGAYRPGPRRRARRAVNTPSSAEARRPLGGAAGRVERLGGAHIPAQGVRPEGRREESGDGEPPVQRGKSGERGENAERHRGVVAERSGGGVRDPSAIWAATPVGGQGSGADYVNVAPCRHRLRADRRAQAGPDRRRRYALPLHGVQEAVGHRADVRRPDRRGARDPRREPGATVRQEAPGGRHPRLPAPLVQRRRGCGRPHRERAAGQAGRLSRGAVRPGCFRPCAAWNSVPGCPVRRP